MSGHVCVSNCRGQNVKSPTTDLDEVVHGIDVGPYDKKTLVPGGKHA